VVILSYKLAISGLVNALKLLQPLKDKYSGVTYADLFQLASATAIEVVLLLLTLEIFIK
jgi:catalase (peroxidase I)